MEENKETLEKVADKLSDELHTVFEMNNEDAFLWILDILNKGAKWQAENKYTEQDMQEYATFCIRCHEQGLPCIIAEDWFKLYKNK
jgi:hypothetical protein